MPLPTLADMIATSSTAGGMMSEETLSRLLTTAAMLASGTGPDGTLLPALSPVGGIAYVTGLTNDNFATDQTSKFVTAAAALPNGGTLYVPAGSYGVVWQVPTNILIFGAGYGGQGALGATVLGIPTGNTTAKFCLDLGNQGSGLFNLDAIGNGAGITHPLNAAARLCSTVLVDGPDTRVMRCHIKDGGLSSLNCNNNANRSQLFAVVTEGPGVNGLLKRTITNTISFTNNSHLLTDSGNSFGFFDLGLVIAPDSGPGPGLADTLGILKWTRIVPNSYVSINNAGVAVPQTGTPTVTLNAIVAATALSVTSAAAVDIPASGSFDIPALDANGNVQIAVLSYTSVTTGANSSLNGIAIVSGTGTWTVTGSTTGGSGSPIIHHTSCRISQNTNAAGTWNTSSLFLAAGYSAIVGATDTQVTGCRFVTGSTIYGGEGLAPNTNVWGGTGGSAAVQVVQTHHTNTMTAAGASHSPGNICLETSCLFGAPTYIDSCPANGAAITHVAGIKQAAFTGFYAYNNISTNPVFYLENGVETTGNGAGVTLRYGLFQSPKFGAAGSWSFLCQQQPAGNLDTQIIGVDAVDATVFQGTTLAGLFTGSVGVANFGCGMVQEISVNDILLTSPTVPANIAVTQSATPAINTDTAVIFTITGLAQAITSMTTNLTGVGTDGQTIEIRITDNGTGRAITWGASFVATTVALPTTTVANNRLRVWFEWDAAAAKWACVRTA